MYHLDLLTMAADRQRERIPELEHGRLVAETAQLRPTPDDTHDTADRPFSVQANTAASHSTRSTRLRVPIAGRLRVQQRCDNPATASPYVAHEHLDNGARDKKGRRTMQNALKNARLSEVKANDRVVTTSEAGAQCSAVQTDPVSLRLQPRGGGHRYGWQRRRPNKRAFAPSDLIHTCTVEY